MYTFDIKCVDRKSLAKVFDDYKSWKQLAVKDSEFVQFLTEVCEPEDDEYYKFKLVKTKCLEEHDDDEEKEDGLDLEKAEEEEILFSTLELRLLGLLWCNGSSFEKA